MKDKPKYKNKTNEKKSKNSEYEDDEELFHYHEENPAAKLLDKLVPRK